MAQFKTVGEDKAGAGAKFVAWLGRFLVAVIIPLIAFAVIYYGFIFLRDSDAPKWITAAVAIVWGVGGVAVLYWVFNGIVERLPDQWTERLQPFVFVGPAMAILIWYLALPSVRTFYLSLFGRDGPPRDMGFFQTFASDAFVGLQNYVAIFSERLLTEALRNNFMWIVFGSTLSVALGLLVAVLADRSKFERAAKSLIFLPMAISFVGASVIWNFMYEVRPVDQPQIGLLNSLLVSLGGNPVPFDKWAAIAPWNNLFLIIIVVWLQAGFAMVLFSAALKGIPEEIIEAARVDGATEIQVFFGIMIPYIMGTIITVWTTVVIFTLKIFDVVWVMTGGQYGTHVVATQFYRQAFTARNSGFGSAIAIVLLITVIPVMIYNLRQFRQQEAF
ncbi:MAG: ABC transporter [Anaerolineaceae bacterium 4572_32.2]|nr:MAG: ABC transporter [Anaerolineaceae bacterium 4572_32.2]